MGIYSRLIFPRLCDWGMRNPRIERLRSEILAGNSLGAALSDHVRTVGATSDLTVHLELDESPEDRPRWAASLTRRALAEVGRPWNGTPWRAATRAGPR